MSSPDRYAIIGQPVAQSRSPFIHAEFAKQTGQAIQYDRIEASPAALAATVADFFLQGGRGLNVTAPHKETTVRLASTLTERARLAGAVNTLARLDDGTILGDNTDGPGLIRDLTINQQVALAGQRVLLIGAGGAARGVMAPLLEQRPAELVVVNRTAERATQLAERFTSLGPVRAAELSHVSTQPYHLIIHATAAGFTGETPKLSPSLLAAATFCYDMAYAMTETPFVYWARQSGCRRVSMGLGMLVEQAAESFQIWRGVRPDTSHLLRDLSKL